MSLDDVRQYWMKIGTSNKNIERKTPRFGRLKTGSKGIGRFACRRLGLNLRLTTCAEVRIPKNRTPRYQKTFIEFNWKAFKPGIDVESVWCDGHTEVLASGETGTTLEIWGGTADEWQTRGFNYLQRQLAVLASNRGVERDGYEPDPGFNVILSAPNLTDKSIDLRDSIVDAT